MVETSRYRSVGLAVLAVGIVIGPAAVLAGGGLGSPADGSATGPVLDEADRSTPLDPELLGASGVLPTMRELRAGAVTMVAPGDPAVIPPGSIAIPSVVLDAYRRAERILAVQDPTCGVSWSLLAGIGRVVTDHARGGGLDERGTTVGPILGPSLDGSPGVAEIADTDDGRFDGDRTWDRAGGPMQIIPSVWQRVGADSDRDGTADPHNVYDAALAAGRYLCEKGVDLRTSDGQVRAAFRYQRSEPFVRSTMLWTQIYDAAAPPDPVSALPPVEDVPETGSPPLPAPLPSGPVSAPVSALPAGEAPPGSTPGSTPALTPTPPGMPTTSTIPRPPSSSPSPPPSGADGDTGGGTGGGETDGETGGGETGGGIEDTEDDDGAGGTTQLDPSSTPGLDTQPGRSGTPGPS